MDNPPANMNDEQSESLLYDEKKNGKKRRRPRTKAIRFDLKNKLECGILSSESNVLDLLVRQSTGVLQAPLIEVMKRLDLLNDNKFSALSVSALKSISNITRVFQIVELFDDEIQLYKKAKAKSLAKTTNNSLDENLCTIEPSTNTAFGKLWISVDSRICESFDEKTVYVDNLPPQCTEAKLRRRAVVFGSVVNVFLPKIPRIQRNFGTTLALNSGFGFVQFVSKTAVKRFCKRYAANSRQKRVKHHAHHHRKKHSNPNATKPLHDDGMPTDHVLDSNNDYLVGDTESNPGESTFLTMATSFEFHHRQMLLEEEGASDLENKLHSSKRDKVNKENRDTSQETVNENDGLLSNDRRRDVEAWAAKSSNFTIDVKDEIVAKHTKSFTHESLQIILPVCKEITEANNLDVSHKSTFVEEIESCKSKEEFNRFTCGTSRLSFYDSGNDTETDIQKFTKIATDTVKKRNRKKRRPFSLLANNSRGVIGSLTNLLKRIQVFPMKQYRELRSEYLRLKKVHMVALKHQVIASDNLFQPEKKIDLGSNDSLKNSKQCRKRKRSESSRKHKGKSRIFEKAQRLKESSFLILP